MKFAVNVPNYGEDATPATLAHWARTLEELGFHHLMVSDHVALTPDVRRLFSDTFYDPFAVLCWLAGTTDRIGLGTTVAILPYRHPVALARQAAALDQLSGGRFTLGVAAGWSRGEFAALDVPFERRGARSDEYLAVIKACWAEPTVTFEGEFVSVRALANGPQPVQRPGPPIWVGGHSVGAMRRAVRFGDAWHPTSFTREWLTNFALPLLDQVAKELGAVVPELVPRIKVRITEHALGPGRTMGTGTLDEIHSDLLLLDALGAPTVVLDPTFPGEPRTAERNRRDLRALETVARRLVDLGAERVVDG